MPKVSVVIPFYNRIDKTINAINSVLCQTYSDYEIVVVNDGSSEDISLIVQLATQNSDKMKLISYSPNKGASNARNVGIENANGEYIAFLDSDDLFLPQKLEEQLKQMLIGNSCFSHTSYIKISENEQKTIKTAYVTGNMVPKIISSCPIATPTVMLKKDVLISKNLVFDIKLKYGEDTVFWMEILKKYEILGIEEPLTIVNVSKESCVSNLENQLIGYKAIIDYVITDDVYKDYDVEISELFTRYIKIVQSSPMYIKHKNSQKKNISNLFNKQLNWLEARHQGLYSKLQKFYHKMWFN